VSAIAVVPMVEVSLGQPENFGVDGRECLVCAHGKSVACVQAKFRAQNAACGDSVYGKVPARFAARHNQARAEAGHSSVDLGGIPASGSNVTGLGAATAG
jgi:hypothetical protein